MECADILLRTLNLARVKTESAQEMSNSAPGCDDFLPLFIWYNILRHRYLCTLTLLNNYLSYDIRVALQANVPHLCSNCEFIQAFHNPDNLMTKSGYFLVNLRSAIEFILSVDASSLTIDSEEFDRSITAAEIRMVDSGK